MSVTKVDILNVLAQIQDPGSGQDIVASGMVTGLAIEGGHVRFALEVDPARGAALEPLRKAAEEAVKRSQGVTEATVVLTAQTEPGQGQRAKTTQASPPPKGPGAQGPAPKSGPTPAQEQPQDKSIPGVAHIVAVASGKGGVGKSTTSANLALAFAATGKKVGLLDADVYGPSMPRAMGISGKPQSPDGKTIIPMENYGVKVMSMGFLIEEDTPMIWRGPMVQSALTQLLRNVAWGELDVLIIDMPPGTGDAQLTLAQNVPLTGAVIVSTPQDLALLDAKKGVAMFKKTEVPILGMIENMSMFVCPKCGEETPIFGHGGAKAEAEKSGMDFLGAVPLEMGIRTSTDEGKPIVVSAPTSAPSKAYRAIADEVWQRIESAAATQSGPKISFR